MDAYTEYVPPRFASMDENWRNKFLEAMKWEDSKLRYYTDKCQLDRWYESTWELARKIVNKAYDMQTASKVEAGANGSATKPAEEDDEYAGGLL